MAEVAALPTLESFAPVDPGAEARERTLQRQHLAQAAAEIGTALPQRAVAVGPDEIVLRRGDAAHVAEAEPGDEFVAVGEGLREVLAGFQEDHRCRRVHLRSEEHTSELQSIMRTSYAVFCL